MSLARLRTRLSRLAAYAAILCLATLLLTGCGGNAGASTRTLRVWYSTDDPVERAWSQQLARRYEALHPGIQVMLRDYSFEELNTKLQLALSAGDPPDLAYVTPRGPGIPAYVAAHRLRDLTGAARTHRWASELRTGLLTAYNRPFAFYGAPAGSVVAVPTSLAAVGILYNRSLLQRLHLQVPRSLAAFEAALARARSAGYTPVGIGNADGWLGDDWYLTLVNALVPGSSLQPEQQLSPRFSFRRPPFTQAAATLQRWSNRGFFTQDFGGLDAQEGVDLFFQGKTLFQLVSSSENSQILQDQQRTHLSIGIFSF
ncbi:MAG TPA: extracellular solute-binding protein, partial [Chloroflexota bacterium]